MRNTLYICLLLVLLSLTDLAVSQSLFLTRNIGHATVGFDINSIYNYNLYEGHRFGGSAFLDIPVKYDNRFGSDFQKSINISGYGAFGLADEAWKYGGRLEFRLPRNTLRNAFLGFNHDIEIAGLHDFVSYQLLNTISNSGYFSSHFSGIDRLCVGFSLALPHALLLMSEYRHSREQLLFDAFGLLYPSLYDNQKLTPSTFDELHFRLSLRPSGSATDGRAILDVIAGNAIPHEDDASGNTFCRLVVQYERTVLLGSRGNPLSLFAQAGSTLTPDMPISRRFNISGTGGSFYYFNNSLLTVRPNAFMTDIYAMLRVHFGLSKPLWTLDFSKPKPFVQASSLWGALRTGNGFGEHATYDLVTGHAINPDQMPAHETIALFAPFQGLAEFAAGIEDIVRWDYVNIGFAAAYRVTSKKTLYYSDNIFGNIAVMIVARLSV
ncbi:MAG: hypothetical protein IJP80_07815 [Bacteroidales bacterium]|nr:hypothetical protein [Bacteroidales bacterium]